MRQTCSVGTNDAGESAEGANFLIPGVALEVAHKHTVEPVRVLWFRGCHMRMGSQHKNNAPCLIKTPFQALRASCCPAPPPPQRAPRRVAALLSSLRARAADGDGERQIKSFKRKAGARKAMRPEIGSQKYVRDPLLTLFVPCCHFLFVAFDRIHNCSVLLNFYLRT